MNIHLPLESSVNRWNTLYIKMNNFNSKSFKYYRCGFMYGELTDKETVARLEFSLENQQQDQFEILLYKKNSKLLNFESIKFIKLPSKCDLLHLLKFNSMLKFQLIGFLLCFLKVFLKKTTKCTVIQILERFKTQENRITLRSLKTMVKRVTRRTYV